MKSISLLRIPKTASSSIERALKDLQKQKSIKLRVFGHAKKRLNPKKTYIVASVRNPYDRLVSAYHYMVQRNKHDKNPYLNDYSCFEEFCLDIDKLWEKNQFFHPQVMWLYKNEQKNFNYLIRYENLQNDWDKLCIILKCPWIELPVIRKSDRKPWQDYYTQDMKKKVYSVYQKDFNTLGYEF